MLARRNRRCRIGSCRAGDQQPELVRSLSHWSWPLSWQAPEIGAMAATYAFPNHSVEETPTDQIFHFAPDLYPGPVLEIGEFRDHVLVPYPYMNVGCHIHAAASGGPVAI